jgi:hypothetical protein
VDAKTREFLRLFAGSGRILGSPWEPLSVPEVRGIVLQVWGTCCFEPDNKIRQLARDCILSLHEHDFPSSVLDKSTLLKAEGRFFCVASVRHEIVERLK